MEENIIKTIRISALNNALKFKGKCNPKALIGFVMKEHPEIKQNMKKTMENINSIANDINSLTIEEQKSFLNELDHTFLKKQEEKKVKNKKSRHELPELRNAIQGKVVTRVPPEPSKYNHIGHAVSFLINYMYKLKYEGKCILRFEDTNPDKATQEYVDAMKEDIINYLGIKPDEIKVVSDHMDKYISMADTLVEKEQAYICFCEKKDISLNRRAMKECKCRSASIETNNLNWTKMKEGNFNEGDCVLRLKINMQHKNAVMRDPAIYRLNYSNHYRQNKKYKVWPLYDFENSIEEGLCGITHVLRSNEFESRIELQDYIRSLFNLPKVEVRQYGRINIIGATTKGREIRELIESGNYIGWDDPRLVTLKALKRRGIVPKTYYELAKKCGLSKQNTNLDFTLISSINRKIQDETANRFFFIKEPVKITINNVTKKEVEIPMHPSIKERGTRKLKLTNTIYIEKEDYTNMVSEKQYKVHRLMDGVNFICKDGLFEYHSDDFETYKNVNNKGQIIHWLPEHNTITTKIFTPNATYITGIAEQTIETLKEGDCIQFERYAFCRLDKINKKDNIKEREYEFWYTHE